MSQIHHGNCSISPRKGHWEPFPIFVKGEKKSEKFGEQFFLETANGKLFKPTFLSWPLGFPRTAVTFLLIWISVGKTGPSNSQFPLGRANTKKDS